METLGFILVLLVAAGVVFRHSLDWHFVFWLLLCAVAGAVFPASGWALFAAIFVALSLRSKG